MVQVYFKPNFVFEWNSTVNIAYDLSLISLIHKVDLYIIKIN